MAVTRKTVLRTLFMACAGAGVAWATAKGYLSMDDGKNMQTGILMLMNHSFEEAVAIEHVRDNITALVPAAVAGIATPIADRFVRWQQQTQALEQLLERTFR